MLCSLDAPVGFFNILYVLQRLFQGSDRAQELRCVDGYAGAAKIFQVFTNVGFPSAAYNVLNDDHVQNIGGTVPTAKDANYAHRIADADLCETCTTM